MVSLDSGRRDVCAEDLSHFSDDVNLTNEEEELFDHCLVNVNEPAFRQVQTVWVATFSLFALILLEILVFLVPALCHDNHCAVSDVSTLILLQTAFWCLVLVIDQFYRSQHRNLRQFGYLKFYRETRSLKRAPLFIFSSGNAVLLLCVVLLHEYCHQDNSCLSAIHFHPVNAIQAILTLEVLFSFPLVVLYIVRVVSFNKQQLPPDIFHEDLFVNYNNFIIPETEIGYRYDAATNEVIEKQGDYIRYLKQHNANLGRKLLLLASELKTLKSM